MEEWVSVKTAAELRNCSPRNILDLIKREKLQGRKKPDSRQWEVLMNIPEGSSVGTSEPSERSEGTSAVVSALTDQLAEKDRQIERLQQELSLSSERHDTIVLQMTRQLENQQMLLEHKRQPWYKRLRRQQKNME